MNQQASSGRSDPFGAGDPHMDVGAYALGALDRPELAEVEEHLAVCEVCSDRLREFTAIMPFLAELRDTGMPEPPSGDLLGRLMAQVREERRRGRYRRRMAAIGAAALIALGPAVSVLATDEGPSPAGITASAVQHRGSDPATGASAIVGLTSRDWGTQVDLELSGVSGPRTCSLIAVSRHGEQQTVANWIVPKGGYDQQKSEQLSISGSTALPVSDLSHFLVMTAQGQQLVRVTA